MADIFISYSQKDRERVRPLVDALEAEGYTVWWDLDIRAGEAFDERIESTLEQVLCVVGVWSRYSVKSEWVRAESAWAKDEGEFASVRIDENLRLPLKFYHVHTESLVDWTGDSEAPAFHKLIADVRKLAGEPRVVNADAGPRDKPPRQPLIEPADYGRKPLSYFRDRLRDGSEGPEMVVIPGGSFLMGSSGEEPGKGYPWNERPCHHVEIVRHFALGRTTITFEDYDRFAKATGRDHPNDEKWGRGSRPVINVNWDDAVTYTKWLSAETGKIYRLPTEAEWEYACRAGTRTSWSFGDSGDNVKLHAWYSKNSGGMTQPVGQRLASSWGLYDMHGNVAEWVQDCMHWNYENAPADGSAWEDSDGGDCSSRVIRGGSWNTKAKYLRSAARNGDDTDGRFNNIGFRLAQDLEQ